MPFMTIALFMNEFNDDNQFGFRVSRYNNNSCLAASVNNFRLDTTAQDIPMTQCHYLVGI